eukprot:CAMPEP_0185042050 /NCGR_PEP_ID=MMETSP1103-20130426/42097_1 /TAXON_ID=36769 /ORGANISM="Paraphysomonas bandaiensis, Strain Caron Lab Isolate" /LENGTH=731 /DNA_ID=CAMNT_0027582045 /DNA_START=334 /DNA_END=2526 /DNA_ORIENTATION=+
MGACSSYSGGAETYHRPALTYPPVFENLIIGNMNDVKEKIEESLLDLCESHHGQTRIKEKLCFRCVINPPRHGKSLLLDTLFQSNDTVLVIPISYNGDTSFSTKEIESPQVAKSYFWLRVLKTLLSLRTTLEVLYSRYRGINLNFSRIQKISRKSLLVDPFICVNGTKKNVVICVDEFSLLTDSINKNKLWSAEDKQQFVCALQNEMTAKPFLQYVLTGFNTNVTTLLGYSAAKVDCYVLKMCSFSQSRPLLMRIVDHYRAQNPPVDVPASLFEAIKCTPGLVGLWAECVVRDKRCDRSLVEFQDKAAPNWLKKIVNSDNLIRNWKIILQYLLHLERSYTSIDAKETAENSISTDLIDNQIGIGASGSSAPQIIPLCFVLIVRSMMEYAQRSPANVSVEDLALARLYSQALDACDKTSFNANRKGVHFESFTHATLLARLLIHSCLSREIQDSAPGSYMAHNQTHTQHYSISAEKFFPGPVFKCSSLMGSFYFHTICSKPDLNTFLLPPLYYLFPLTINSLRTNNDNNISLTSSLHKWLKGMEISKKFAPSQQEIDTGNILFQNRDITQNTTGSWFDLVLPIKKGCAAYFENEDQVLGLMNQIKHVITSESLSREGTIKYLDDRHKKDQHSKDKTIKRQSGFLFKLKEGLEYLHDICTKCTPNVYLTRDNAEGADVIMVWCDNRNNADDLASSCSNDDDRSTGDVVLQEKCTIHLAAIELKDQRSTDPAEW